MCCKRGDLQGKPPSRFQGKGLGWRIVGGRKSGVMGVYEVGGHLARSVSRVTVALSIVSSVFQLISFLVGCSGIILKGFGFLAFFASVKASSFCIHLSCLVCSLSVVRGEWIRLFCGHKGRNLPEVSIASFLSPKSKSNFLIHTKT
jgi:hypothetical protein